MSLKPQRQEASSEVSGPVVNEPAPPKQKPQAYYKPPFGKAGDVEARIDRLSELIAQLVQSDEQVHSQNSPEEEKCSVCKGTEEMKDEEVDLLVKAKVDAAIETLEKAYKEQIDELKKANTDLVTRIEKSENEIVQKSGVAVILREGDETLGTVIKSNAAAISEAQKAKAKV
jgi:F0F1-type ATP synthase epsilon subunit